MSERATLARPYATAAFNFAVEHHDVVHWQSMLTFAAEVSRNKNIVDMLSGTVVAIEKLAETFIAVCGENINVFAQNLIRIMSENRRLAILPEVLQHFMLLCEQKNGTVKVDVITARPLKKEQMIKIIAAMEQHLSRKVKLNCTLNTSVVAGCIIRAGDMVIDGSVRGRLERLADVLQS